MINIILQKIQNIKFSACPDREQSAPIADPPGGGGVSRESERMGAPLWRSSYFLFLVMLFFLIITCSEREPLNPLDPENPFTHGAPTGIKIYTNRDTVDLSWNPIDVVELFAYEIFRGSDSTTLDSISSVPADCTSYKDLGLEYDIQYYYAVRGVTEYYKSNFSDTVYVTPGPMNIWIAEMYTFSLRHLSYDGSWLLKYQDFISPRAIEYDSGEKLLWLADYYEKHLIGLNPELDEKYRIDLSGFPLDIAIDVDNKKIYVVQRDRYVKGFTYSGDEFLSLTLEESISSSSEIVYDKITNSLWITMYDYDLVYQIRLNSDSPLLIKITGVDGPGPVEVDNLDGGVWVATRDGLFKIKSDSLLSTYKQNWFIRDISIDPATGDCYYVANLKGVNQWETGKLPYLNPAQSEKILGNEYDHLYNIQVIPGIGDSGFIVQQAYTWRLLRFTSSGEKIGEMPGFDSVIDFALD